MDQKLVYSVNRYISWSNFHEHMLMEWHLELFSVSTSKHQHEDTYIFTWNKNPWSTGLHLGGARGAFAPPWNPGAPLKCYFSRYAPLANILKCSLENPSLILRLSSLVHILQLRNVITDGRYLHTQQYYHSLTNSMCAGNEAREIPAFSCLFNTTHSKHTVLW